MTVTDQSLEFYRNQDSESILVRGSAVAPAANAVLVTNTPPAGVYDITVIARYGAVADIIDNMDLRVNNVAIAALPVLPAVNGMPVVITVRKRLTGAQAVSVNAVAAGGAGAVFVAHLILIKVSE